MDERLAGWAGLPWAAGIWLAALLLRLAIDPFVLGVPFLTFFPAVLAASVLVGWRWGSAVMIASAVAANLAFQPPYMAVALGQKEIVSSVGFIVAGGLIVLTAEALRRAVQDVARAAAREAELNSELNHRVNNNLAVVQALAMQTQRLASGPEAFTNAFSHRLVALSEANRVLSGAGWEVSPLPRLAEAALRPFLGSGQISVQGPAADLPPISCVPLVLALHELATNASKYGSLASERGHVDLAWTLDGSVCRLTWRESGGPTVAPPTRRGLGARLLQAQSGIEAVDLRFDPAGVVCELVVEGARAA